MATTQIETLRSLHRGEIAATETYVQALDALEDDPARQQLEAIRNDHRDFANELRQLVHNVGEEPDQDSGIWGSWAKLVEGTASSLSRQSALSALKQGEEHGINVYESALEDDIPEDHKRLIRTKYLPKTHQHIATLDQLMEMKA